MIRIYVKHLSGVKHGYWVTHPRIEDILKNLKAIVEKEKNKADLSSYVVFVDDENEEVRLDDNDSYLEAVKVGQKMRELNLFVKKVAEIHDEDSVITSTVPKTENGEATPKAAERKSHRAMHSSSKEIEAMKTIINAEDRCCSNCSLLIPSEIDGSIVNICISNACHCRLFCEKCATSHDSYHVMLRLPTILCEKRRPLIEKTDAIIRSTKKHNKRRGLSVVSQNFELIDNVLHFEWLVLNIGRSIGRGYNVEVIYSTLPPVNNVVKLTSMKAGEKGVVKYALKFDNPLENDLYKSQTIKCVVCVRSSDQTEFYRLQQSVPILLLQPGGEKNVSLQQNQHGGQVEDQLKFDSVCDEASLISCPDDESQKGDELDEEFADFFTSASADQEKQRRESLSTTNSQDGNDSFAVEGSFDLTQMDSSDDGEMEMVARPEKEEAEEEKPILQDEACLEEPAGEIWQQNKPDGSPVENLVVENTENNEGSIVVNSVETESSAEVIKENDESSLMTFSVSQPSETETKQEPTVEVTEPAVQELHYDRSNDVHEETVIEATASNARENRERFQTNSADALTDFLSKMLRSTSHAFENVSVASSQAFAAVNDTLEMLQTITNKNSSASSSLVDPLPQPVVRNKKQSVTSSGTGEKFEQKADPTLVREKPVAWVPKSTQTPNSENEKKDRSVGPSSSDQNELVGTLQRPANLRKNDKDLEEFLRKARILTDLGFLDGAKNGRLLMEHNGDLNAVLDALLNKN